MKHFLTLMGLSILAASALADIPPPPPKGVPMRMLITKNSIGDGGPVLQIPAKLFQTKHAAFLDIRPPQVGSSSMSLVVAGVLLAAGVFFAGRFFWNRRKKETGERIGPPLAGLVIGSLLVLGAGTLIQKATADDRGSLGEAVAEGRVLQGTVTIQVRDDISEVGLYLTRPRRPIWHPPSK